MKRLFAWQSVSLCFLPILVCVFLFSVSNNVGAEGDASDYDLGQVVVTATKTERILSDVPIRTEVISSDEISAKGATNLYEALESVPGIRVEQQCSYCNFSDVRMQGLESGHVQILIDGQPLFTGVTSVYGLQQIPASMIDRIEVVKGPGSALYGSSAIAGVINVITKTPSEDPAFEVETVFGEHRTNKYSILGSYPTENVDVLIYAQRDEGDEIYDGEKPGSSHMLDRVWSRSNTLGTRLNFKDVIGEDKLTLGARIYSEERKGGELETYTNPFAAASESIDSDRYELQAGYEKPFSDIDMFNMTFSMFQHYRDATNDTFLGDYKSTHADAEPSLNEMEPYRAKEQQYNIDINYHRLIGERHQFLGGFQYSYNKLDESGKYVVVDDTASDYGNAYESTSEKHAHEYGIYLQDEIAILDNLTWLIGARYDIHRSEDSFAGSGDTYGKSVSNELNEKSFNPRTSLMYKPINDLSLRLAVGKGFRVPYGFSEDLHLCSGSPRVFKPGDLKSEESLGANLSADYKIGRFVPYVSLFRTNLENKIGLVDASATARAMGYDYEWENLGDAYTQGVEVGSDFVFSDLVQLEVDFTYTDAKYDNERADWVHHPVHGNQYASDSKHISRVPKFTSGVGFALTPKDWEINFGTDYTGRMYIDYYENDDVDNPGSEIVHTKGFWVANMKISKHNFLRENLTAYIGARNLFDEIQKDKRPDDAAFMYAPYYGRIIYAGMKLSF